MIALSPGCSQVNPRVDLHCGVEDRVRRKPAGRQVEGSNSPCFLDSRKAPWNRGECATESH